MNGFRYKKIIRNLCLKKKNNQHIITNCFKGGVRLHI